MSTIQIPLGGKIGAGKFVLIDVVDLSLVRGRCWHVLVRPHTIYAATDVRSEGGKRRTELLHCLLLPNAPRVDHVNGNGLDNRRSNLRPATNGENQHNRRMDRRNTSGFKGVSWYRPTGKWVAMIGCDNKRTNLGYYNTPEEAALVYDQAAERLFGEFAKTNAMLGLL